LKLFNDKYNISGARILDLKMTVLRISDRRNMRDVIREHKRRSHIFFFIVRNMGKKRRMEKVLAVGGSEINSHRWCLRPKSRR